MLFIGNFTPANFEIKNNHLIISTVYVDGSEKKFRKIKNKNDK
jgi:hypothetical protein